MKQKHLFASCWSQMRCNSTKTNSGVGSNARFFIHLTRKSKSLLSIAIAQQQQHDKERNLQFSEIGQDFGVDRRRRQFWHEMEHRFDS
jgi:hypothetical protein